MGDLSIRYAKTKRAAEKRDDDGGGHDDELNDSERHALAKIRKEAKAKGSVLTSGGKGGLSPSLVLGVMRRDDFMCKTCGSRGNGDNGGIGVHHKGGIVESKWLSKKGHQNDKNNIVTICARCHDKVHNKAREEGVDSSQVTPDGDKGTDRDRGKG